LGLAGLGTNFRVCYGGFSNRDASNLWNGIGFTQTVGSVNFADEAISLSYKIENLAPGETETFKFVVILDDASATAAINNLLYLFYPSSFTAPPSVCTPYTDTARTCGAAIPIGVLGTSVGDFNWSWSPGTGLSSTTGSSVIANPPVTTTYTVSGTPITPCLAPVSLVIVVQVTPSEGANPVITPVPAQCVSSPPITLTVDSTGGVWGGDGITNATTGVFDPADAGVGTHLITYQTPGLCNTLDTMYIEVVSAATPTITYVPPTCFGDPAFNLTAATGGGTWTGPGITDGTAGTFDPGTAGVGTHVITYNINIGTCVAVDTISITIFGSSNPAITPHVPVCAGSAPFNFTAATAGGTWSGTGITNATAGTFTPPVTGSYIITYTISGACGATDTVHQAVLPVANATITAPAAVCAGSPSFNLSAAQSGGTWSGTGITNPAAGTFNPSTAGTFVVTYSIGGFCGDTATQNVVVNPIPTPSFTTNVTSGCVPLCVQFNEAAGTNCASVLYSFGDTATSTTSDPSHCYTASGTYSVTITCTDNNSCTGTTLVSNLITVYDIPVASFTIAPATIVAPNTDVTFTDQSTGGGSVSWNFGDPLSGFDNFGTGSPETHSYAAEGEYCIEMVANNNGCLDTAKNCLIVIQDASVFIPNVFTPNGDGENDSFLITNYGVKALECDIYDRWGLLIAHFDGTTSFWDGKTKNGKLAPDGTYFYVLKITAINEKVSDFSGYIQLLRSK
jgi:gliding motility-associated-like protein